MIDIINIPNKKQVKKLLEICSAYIKIFKYDLCKDYNLETNSINVAKQCKIRLGKTEKLVLDYLMNYRFNRNQPCFEHQNIIAKKIGIKKERLSQVIKSLSDKFLLLKINYFTNREQRIMLVPFHPIIYYCPEAFFNLNAKINIYQNSDQEIQRPPPSLNRNSKTEKSVLNRNSKSALNRNYTVKVLKDNLLNLLQEKNELRVAVLVSNLLKIKEKNLAPYIYIYLTIYYLTINLSYKDKLIFFQKSCEPEVENLNTEGIETLNTKKHKLLSKQDQFEINSRKIIKNFKPKWNPKETEKETLMRSIIESSKNTDRIKKVRLKGVLSKDLKKSIDSVKNINLDEDRIEHIFDLLINEYDYEYNKLHYSFKNTLDAIVLHEYNIDIKKHFRVSTSNPKAPFNAATIESRKQLIKLVCGKHSLVSDNFVVKMMECWNGVCVKVNSEASNYLKKANTNNRTSKNFLNAKISLSHSFYFIHGQNPRSPKDQIERLIDAKKYFKYPFFKSGTGLTFNDFIGNPRNNKSLNAYTSETEFCNLIYSFKCKDKYKELIEEGRSVFKENYVLYFYRAEDSKRGWEQINRFDGLIDKWIQNRLDQMQLDPKKKVGKVDLCGFRLITNPLTSDEEVLIIRLFDFINEDDRINGRNRKWITSITSEEVWSEFIHYMRNDYGYTKLFRLKDEFKKKQKG